MLYEYIMNGLCSWEFQYIKSIFSPNGLIEDKATVNTDEFADYYEIVIYLNRNRKVLFNFSLDGVFLSIALGESGRKNEILLVQRNYNQDIYLFEKNIENLRLDELDFYLDYYNEHVIEDKASANRFLKEIKVIISKLCLSEELPCNQKKYIQQFISWIDSYLCDSLPSNNLYSGTLSVLPPSVRPDLDSHYIIVQTSYGCRLKTMRNRACAFCGSYKGVEYKPLLIEELINECKLIQKIYPKQCNHAKYVFLADGDALYDEDIVKKLNVIKELFPKIQGFESFISTTAILQMPDDTWISLKRHGLVKVYWGVESANDETLRLLEKPHSRKTLEQAKAILEANDISYEIIVMAGIGALQKNPEERKKSVKTQHVVDTCEFINSSQCHGVFISRLQLLQGTKFWEMKKSGDIIPYSNEELSSEYRDMIAAINKDVRGSYGNQFVASGNHNK